MPVETRRLVKEMMKNAPGFAQDYVVGHLRRMHGIDPKTANTVLDQMVNDGLLVRKKTGYGRRGVPRSQTGRILSLPRD